MTNNLSWLDLAKGLQEITQSGQLLRVQWHAYEGSTDYGVWHLLPEDPETNEARARFGLFAARAIQKLRISPLPTPLARQHFPDWDRYCQIEEDMARSSGRAIDLSKAVPYGLGVVDKDAVDPCIRAWLEWLRRNNPAFRWSEGRQSLGDRHYKTFSGEIADLCGASRVTCLRLARDEVGRSHPPIGSNEKKAARRCPHHAQADPRACSEPPRRSDANSQEKKLDTRSPCDRIRRWEGHRIRVLGRHPNQH